MFKSPISIQRILCQPKFSQGDSPLTMEDFEKITQIQSGLISNTFLYELKSNGQKVCMIMIDLIKRGVQDYSDLEQEANILKQMKHPNIIDYITHFHYENNLVIITEYLEGISLS
jgi:serine/threonine protein kinase